MSFREHGMLFCSSTVLHSHMLPKLKSSTVNHADPVHMAPLPDDAGHVDGFPQLGLSFESGRNLLRSRSPKTSRKDQTTPSR